MVVTPPPTTAASSSQGPPPVPDSAQSIFSREEHSYDTWSCETGTTPPPPPPNNDETLPTTNTPTLAVQQPQSQQTFSHLVPLTVATKPLAKGPPPPGPDLVPNVPLNAQQQSSSSSSSAAAASSKPPLHPSSYATVLFHGSPPPPHSSSSSTPGSSSINPFATTDTLAATQEPSSQHRRQKSAPPTVIVGTPMKRKKMVHVRTPFDESSEEPSIDVSDASTQHAQASSSLVGSPTTTTTTMTTPHPPPQSTTAPPPQTREPTPKWDSSDRTMFPILDIQRMKSKVNKLRTSSVTRSSSSSSEQAHLLSQGQATTPRDSTSSLCSESSFNPFGSAAPITNHNPTTTTTTTTSSSLFSESSYNPFATSSSTNQPATTTRTSSYLSESTYNPFAALVAAVSSDSADPQGDKNDAESQGDSWNPVHITVHDGTDSRRRRRSRSLSVARSTASSQDGSQSSSGSKVDGQSVRRRSKPRGFPPTDSTNNNNNQEGRIWSSPPTTAPPRDSEELLSLGDASILDGYPSPPPKPINEHRSTVPLAPPQTATNSTTTRPRSGTEGSQKSVEQSLVQSFSRKGRRPRTPSPAPRSTTALISPEPATPTSTVSSSTTISSVRPNPTLDDRPPLKSHSNKALVHSVRSVGRSSAEAPLDELEELDESQGDTTTHEGTEEPTQEDDDDDDENDQQDEEEPDFTLHDLCGEASSTDDIAWRNALYLLSIQPQLASIRDNAPDSPLGGDDTPKDASLEDSQEDEQVSGGHGWTPLHISCLGMHPPPTYITRALLYANPKAVQWRDDGGRLPLHLLAASSADVATMELLLQTWPQAISKRDHKGLTPLHLLLRNRSVQLTTRNTSVLLGLSTDTLSTQSHSHQWKQMQQQQQRFILQRRGEHLKMTLKEMDDYIARRHKVITTVLHPDFDEMDEEWKGYPPDVQVALRNLAKWRNKQQQQETTQKRRGHGKHKNKDTSTNSSSNFLRIVDDSEEDENDHDAVNDLLGETNPAAIPHYPDLKLPIHMAVARGIVQPVPLDDRMASYEEQFEDEDEDDDEHDCDSDESDNEVRTNTKSQKELNAMSSKDAPRRSSVDDVYGVLRCIIAAFPEGLCVRDGDGKTPLLHIMTMTDGLPTLDLIELLLGKRSGAFEEMSPWMSDLPVHSMSSLPDSQSRILSPAMVPSARTNQLPLHIAAEEFLSDCAIVESIYKSYPAAADAQDHRGRTPLHLVFSNYRLFPASPRVISMLLSDTSAKCRDVDGNLPFDLLVQAADCLPKRLPVSWEAGEMARIYQKFFTASLLTPSSQAERPKTSQLLRQLRSLPPWIRRQACSVQFVQEMIIEQLATPLRTACVISDGLLLILTLVLFRIQVKDYTDSSDSGSSVESEYPVSVGTVVSVRIVILSVRAILAANVGQLNYLVLLNGWFWVDLAAMVLTFSTTTLLNNNDVSDDTALSLATGATGLLWLSLLGYCATWCFGMALLLGSLAKIANQIVWPLIAGGMVLVAFAQMFYTLLWTDCATAIPVTPVCSVRDSYRVVYLLLRGESLLELDGSDEISAQAVVLLSAFLLALFALLLAVLVAVIMGALHSKPDEIAFRSFWEPKLAFVLSSADWGCRVQPKISLTPSRKVGLQTRLERTWELLVSSLLVGPPARSEKYWYSGRYRKGGLLGLAFWFTALILLPLWFVLGFLTLGLLWPPQLRQFLVRPLGWTSTRQPSAAAAKEDYTVAQLSEIRSELVRTKTMTYERSIQVENEVRSVKHLLYAAVREEQ